MRDPLGSVDNSARVLVSPVGAPQAPVEQIDRKITSLHTQPAQRIAANHRAADTT